MVHGLGGSHLNWLSIGPRFAAAGYRTLALDLRGFGLTPLMGKSSSIHANQELLHRFIEEVAGSAGLVMGNSMGGLITLLEAKAHPRTVTGFILIAPALPVVSPGAIRLEAFRRIVLPSVPIVGPAYMRRMYENTTPEQQLEETWQLVMARPDRVSPAHREVALEMARLRREMDWAIPAFSEASRSIGQLITRRTAFKKLLHSTTPPGMLIHGELDMVVDPEAARWVAKERPDWAFHMLTDVGHVPQVEVPDLVFNLVDEWRSVSVPSR